LRDGQIARCAVDYTEFREEVRQEIQAKYAKAVRRRELRERWTRICLDSIAILLTAALLVIIILRLKR
jgi:uncharacterized membrane protein